MTQIQFTGTREEFLAKAREMMTEETATFAAKYGDDYHKGIPVAAKLAAVKAYVGKAGSCQPAAMLLALQAAAPMLIQAPHKAKTP